MSPLLSRPPSSSAMARSCNEWLRLTVIRIRPACCT
nr:MAG TPA: hypothetical protein [Caudoviricetes sp.]